MGQRSRPRRRGSTRSRRTRRRGSPCRIRHAHKRLSNWASLRTWMLGLTFKRAPAMTLRRLQEPVMNSGVACTAQQQDRSALEDSCATVTDQMMSFKLSQLSCFADRNCIPEGATEEAAAGADDEEDVKCVNCYRAHSQGCMHQGGSRSS